MYRGFVTLQKRTEVIHPPDKDEDGEDAEPTVEIKHDPLCDFTISIPKVLTTHSSSLSYYSLLLKQKWLLHKIGLIIDSVKNC